MIKHYQANSQQRYQLSWRLWGTWDDITDRGGIQWNIGQGGDLFRCCWTIIDTSPGAWDDSPKLAYWVSFCSRVCVSHVSNFHHAIRNHIAFYIHRILSANGELPQGTRRSKWTLLKEVVHHGSEHATWDTSVPLIGQQSRNRLPSY